MKLAQFIEAHCEDILVEWDAFARTLQPVAGNLSDAELRDHARQIVLEMGAEIAQGEVPPALEAGADPRFDGAASSHGMLRQHTGFSVVQLAAEYRALRTSILRLWMARLEVVTPGVTEDMVRLNETIDRALTQSLHTYMAQVAHTQDAFLSILGHDLRSPLATIAMSGRYLTGSEVGTDSTRQAGTRVLRSAASMNAMVNDLLEYARRQLGQAAPIRPVDANLKDVCQRALDDAGAANPHCIYEFFSRGDLCGAFDSDRLLQVFFNMLNYAAQHRALGKPVLFSAVGGPDAIVFEVKNEAPILPFEALATLFDPVLHAPKAGEDGSGPPSSSGLGLYIAREIVHAHGGHIEAEANALLGTVIRVRLPRVAV